eukprot:scaffold53143_cov23-Tisochrysis_lutea.AAC.4
MKLLKPPLLFTESRRLPATWRASSTASRAQRTARDHISLGVATPSPPRATASNVALVSRGELVGSPPRHALLPAVVASVALPPGGPTSASAAATLRIFASAQ